MSSDTAREDASVVDSSVTEWKHDMGNSDGPGKMIAYFSLFFSFILKFLWSVTLL